MTRSHAFGGLDEALVVPTRVPKVTAASALLMDALHPRGTPLARPSRPVDSRGQSARPVRPALWTLQGPVAPAETQSLSPHTSWTRGPGLRRHEQQLRRAEGRPAAPSSGHRPTGRRARRVSAGCPYGAELSLASYLLGPATCRACSRGWGQSRDRASGGPHPPGAHGSVRWPPFASPTVPVG